MCDFGFKDILSLFPRSEERDVKRSDDRVSKIGAMPSCSQKVFFIILRYFPGLIVMVVERVCC